MQAFLSLLLLVSLALSCAVWPCHRARWRASVHEHQDGVEQAILEVVCRDEAACLVSEKSLCLTESEHALAPLLLVLAHVRQVLANSLLARKLCSSVRGYCQLQRCRAGYGCCGAPS